MSILYYVVSELTSEYKAQNRLGGIGQNGSFRRIYGARGCATAVSRSADTYTSLLIAQAPIPSTSRRSSGSGSRTTLDRYGHLMPEMHQAAARKLDRLVFGEAGMPGPRALVVVSLGKNGEAGVERAARAVFVEERAEIAAELVVADYRRVHGVVGCEPIRRRVNTREDRCA